MRIAPIIKDNLSRDGLFAVLDQEQFGVPELPLQSLVGANVGSVAKPFQGMRNVHVMVEIFKRLRISRDLALQFVPPNSPQVPAHFVVRLRIARCRSKSPSSQVGM